MALGWDSQFASFLQNSYCSRMSKTKSDISNSAIRIFLLKVGQFYDQQRGFKPFQKSVKTKTELLQFFDNKCCYCLDPLNILTVSLDHLIPINKNSLGLHAWGNIVPCCNSCNNKKQSTQWKDFVKKKLLDEKLQSKQIKLLNSFVKSKNYNPNLNISEFANNLYRDVGEVSMTLINLRYQQAEEEISRLVKK